MEIMIYVADAETLLLVVLIYQWTRGRGYPR